MDLSRTPVAIDSDAMSSRVFSRVEVFRYLRATALALAVLPTLPAISAGPQDAPLRGDANGDGAVTKPEVLQFHRTRFEKFGGALDTPSGTAKEAAAEFRAIDANGDGWIAIDEYLVYFSGAAATKGAGMAAPPAAPAGKGWAGRAPVFRKADADGDGKVSLKEYLSFWVD